MIEVLHFDARFIRLDHHDGISRFSVELIKALSKKIRVVAIVYDLRQLEKLPDDELERRYRSVYNIQLNK